MPFSGWLMSRDKKVAEIKDGVLKPLKPQLLPFFFQENGDVEAWMESRAMDWKSRPNARLLRKAFRISDLSAADMVQRVEAASVTDTYWLKPEGSSLQYTDVRFQSNEFWQAALRGPSLADFSKPFSRTPELTNTGSFEKCWHRDEAGIWWLYKKGTPEQIFSEAAAYKIARYLGYPVAQYEVVDETTIRSRDFTNGASVNFEPASSLKFSSDNITDNYAHFRELSPELAMQYAQIVTMDALIVNADRHSGNFGFLRDVDTGAVLSLAPNYDNNLSLLAIHYDQQDGLDRFMVDWRNMTLFNRVPIRLRELTPDVLTGLVGDIPCDVDKAAAVKMLTARAGSMQEFLRLHRQTLYPANAPGRTIEPTLEP